MSGDERKNDRFSPLSSGENFPYGSRRERAASTPDPASRALFCAPCSPRDSRARALRVARVGDVRARRGRRAGRPPRQRLRLHEPALSLREPRPRERRLERLRRDHRHLQPEARLRRQVQRPQLALDRTRAQLHGDGDALPRPPHLAWRRRVLRPGGDRREAALRPHRPRRRDPELRAAEERQPHPHAVPFASLCQADDSSRRCALRAFVRPDAARQGRFQPKARPDRGQLQHSRPVRPERHRRRSEPQLLQHGFSHLCSVGLRGRRARLRLGRRRRGLLRRLERSLRSDHPAERSEPAPARFQPRKGLRRSDRSRARAPALRARGGGACPRLPERREHGAVRRRDQRLPRPAERGELPVGLVQLRLDGVCGLRTSARSGGAT